MDPFTRDEAADLFQVARESFPEWYPWVLCGLRTGMRLGELLALQGGDFDWRSSTIRLSRNIVRGQLTTPKTISADGSMCRRNCQASCGCGAVINPPSC
jgi:integrase